MKPWSPLCCGMKQGKHAERDSPGPRNVSEAPPCLPSLHPGHQYSLFPRFSASQPALRLSDFKRLTVCPSMIIWMLTRSLPSHFGISSRHTKSRILRGQKAASLSLTLGSFLLETTMNTFSALAISLQTLSRQPSLNFLVSTLMRTLSRRV